MKSRSAVLFSLFRHCSLRTLARLEQYRRGAASRALCCFLLLVLGASLRAQSFTEVAIQIPGVRYGAVAWGDYDNDGDLDLLVAGETGNGDITRIYRNDGGGVFTDIGAGLPGISDGAAAWGDYNGDGFLDIALTGMPAAGGARISRIYVNNRNGTFTDINAGLPGLEGSTVAWGDYDNDGDLDLFLTGYTGSTYVGAIYRNNGDGTFSDSGITSLRGGASGSAAWADFDQDGDLDLMFAGFTLDTGTGQASRLYRNNNGTFTNITSISLTPMSLCSVSWSDYDNDGDLDLLMAGSYIVGVQSFPTLRLYRNDGGGAFAGLAPMGGAQNCSVSWGDFDADGDPDVAIAGYNTSFQPFTKIYRNDGGNVFTDLTLPLTGVIDAAVACGDFDGDGDLDLIVAGFDGTTNVTKLYRNNSGTPNVPPNPPLALGSSVSGRTANFYWMDMGDPNQFGGLTFNLRVGSSPGAADIMSPMANIGSGLRRVSRLGNAGQQSSWTLQLPIGTYYWGVQAVDHSFAGSLFSDEQVIVVPPQAPEVTTLGATNVSAAGTTLLGTANPNGDATLVWFEYGTTTSYGSSTSPQDLGNGVKALPFSSTISSLVPGSTYYYRAVASNNYGITYGTNRSFVATSFAEVSAPNLIGASSGAVAWGDYDGDGFLDLVTAGVNSTGLVTTVYHNLGGTNFVDIKANLPGFQYGSLSWGDYDNDGDLDLAITGNYMTRVYRNDAGVFTDINANLAGQNNNSALAWVDVDNDGDLDLVVSSGGNGSALFCRNDGNDQFTPVTTTLPQVYDSSLSVADFDNDGDPDLLISGYNYGPGSSGETTRLYQNDGRGTFANSGLSFQAVSKSSTSWGDYDNDGDLDLLLSGSYLSSRYSMLYSNMGAGTFRSITISSVAKVDQGTIAWGDYDNDGDLDILLVGQASTGAVARVYRNDANVFRDSGAVLPALSNARAAWGDFDNDGRLDIILQGYNGSNYVAKIFRNLSPAPDTRPTAPAALSASVINAGARLDWGVATDQEQPAGLTYNVRIGTAPGRADVLNPMANLVTGARYVPRLGNANLRRFQTITNLAVGTYYWSVQAVDHAYAGSAFSTNASFTITKALLPPLAATLPATNLSLTAVTLPGTANAKGSPTTAFFQYGITTNFGGTTPGLSIGSGTTNVPVSVSLTGLIDGTTYYFRCAASNVNGTVYGATLSFTTSFQFSNLVTALPNLGAGSYDWAGCAAWGDFDNDGLLDLALTGLNLPTTQLYHNDGNNVFTAVTSTIPPGYYGTLEWGDYDNDGRLDLLVAGNSGLLVAHNLGGGTFFLVMSNMDGLFGSEFATWVDYDNDGDLDICSYDHVANNQSYAQARLYRNDAGVFVASGIPLPKLTAGWMAWGDYDGDGHPDLVISGQVISNYVIVPTTAIYRNDGNGVFTDIQAPLTGLQGSRIAWGDYDNDGDLDLLCSGNDGSASRTILYRNDQGIFADAGAGLPGSSGPAGWADFDNDGNLDLFLNFPGYYYSTNRVYRNLGSGGFAPTGAFFLGASFYYVPITSVAWADYDRDGDLDALVGGNQLYLNNNLRQNPSPNAPAGLGATTTGNQVTLRWTPPPDANQSGGLTYNLQVGTAPDTYNILSPAADNAGRRRVARPGIAAAPLWKLVLPAGTYYWRVQAIDHSLASSEFSSESSFSISTQAPLVITDFGTTNNNGYPVLNGSVNANGLPTTAYFQYGLTNFEFRTTPESLVGTTPVRFSKSLSALIPEQVYSYRMFASNSAGTSAGVTRTCFVPYFIDRGSVLISGDSWADSDGDGRLDSLSLGSYSTVLFHNDGGVWTNVAAYLPSANSGCAAWGDYDNDGDLDLFLSGLDNSWGRHAYLFRNDGTNHFTQIPVPLTGVYWSTAAWADFNADGKLDLVVVGADSYNVPLTQILMNQGNDTFTLLSHGLVPVSNGAVACADFDNDGNVDILLAGATTGNVRVCKLYRNDGYANFSDTGLALPGFETGTASWGDYDGDGYLDLLLNGLDQSNHIARVYHNDTGVLRDAQLGLVGVQGGSAWIDYDNDGRLDIVVKGFTNVWDYNSRLIRVYRNLGGGAFADAHLTLPQAYDGSRTVLCGDFDNDGDVDLGLGPNSLLRNSCPVSDPPPAVPTGLTATVVANSVTLRWQPATDLNQTGGLSYNVRLGTAPGAGDIVSGMATPSGARLLPALGNAFGRLYFNLRNLRPGTYYWAVQAIDYSQAASPFAGGGSFVIPIQAPGVIPLSVSNLLADTVTLNSQVNPNGSPTIVHFEYGTTTNYGLQTVAKDVGSGTVPLLVTNDIAGLAHITVYHYRVVASNSLGTTFGPDQTFLTPQFTILNLGFDGAGAFGPADYDNDGSLDLMFARDSANSMLLLHNNGLGAFTLESSQFPSLNGVSFDWGDYDRDGDLDLLVSGSGSVALYRNDGNGVLTPVNANLPNIWGTLRWGDYDNDGDLDILISSGASTQVYRNVGGDWFVKAVDLPGTGAWAEWGDYDNDGRLDIAVSGVDANGNPLARVYHNNGAAGFTNSAIALANLYGEVAWGDYDNDGRLDLLLSGGTNNWAGAPGQTRLYHNLGGGQFAEVPTTLPQLKANVLWADYDNDGDLDIVVSGMLLWDRAGAVYRNDGNGLFTNINAGLLPLSGDGLACGDFNNDGNLDFLVSGNTSPGSAYLARLYQNNNARSNTPPAAPTGLKATLGAGIVQLSWAPATDPNQSGGFSYNLRVGTTPGGYDIVSPSAAPNGWQRVPRLGNVQQNLTWQINNLPAGTYYWSVQAVDNSFAGSPFAPEQTFVAGGQPIADPQLVVLAEDTTQPITLTASDWDNYPLTWSITSQPTNGVLSGTPPDLLYRPNTNYFGTDAFSFKVNNGLADSLPALVSLIITPVQDVPTSSLAIRRQANGQPLLTLTGEPYEHYLIEISPDLKQWSPVTNVASSNGLMALLLSDASLYPHRYYRAALAIPPATLSIPHLSAEGTFALNFSAEVARTYQVQASTDLVTWTSLTNVVMIASSMPFEDPIATNRPARFYRIRPLP